MKKTLIIFFSLWLIGGFLYFFFGSKDEAPTTPRTQATSDYNQTTEIEWNVEKIREGNYIPPDFKKHEHYNENEAEIHHHDDLEIPTIPNDRLMNLFDLAQHGLFDELSGIVNPNLVYKDFDNVNELDKIDEQAKKYAAQISRNHSIKKVKISKPKQQQADRVTYDVIIEYQDNKNITLKDIVMMKGHVDDNDWYLDMTLKELSNWIQTEASR
ncbi:hypothetical protein AM501_04340 [Aneurinibacillus migulanus]|uniref:hypothetical protein n=1 Tax=Aneurinibacillus migulanus TaxID=47500 RepID=UPI0005BA32C2|nr:hypothetical protein [Aneurinibacillus migulanus]KIV56487.1 hypothetical protein TS64_09505 [Aneurinibacillus migulanus]KPD09419.1 hypothetical protein AM501_04340 [Aneurinibacillus migulanus]